MQAIVLSVLVVGSLIGVHAVPKCPGVWTPYYNVYKPDKTGDLETLHNVRKKFPHVCADPLAIEIKLADSDHYWYEGGNYIDVDKHKTPKFGFACYNHLQKHPFDRYCKDYRVRFCCLPVRVCKGPGAWTPWIDRDDPSGNGDYETLHDIRKEKPWVCAHPTEVDAVLRDGHKHYLLGGNNLVLSKDKGLICENKKQPKGVHCKDYKVRFCCYYPEPKCDSAGQWTQWFDRDNPSATGDWEDLHNIIKENPGKVCSHPLNVHGQLINGKPWQLGYDKVWISKDKGLVCKNKEQSDGKCNDYRVRFCCRKPYWTPWVDTDDPNGTGDYETIDRVRQYLLKKGITFCAKPKKIEALAKTSKGYILAEKTYEKYVYYNPYKGLLCLNKDQKHLYKYQCYDYKVRFYCEY